MIFVAGANVGLIDSAKCMSVQVWTVSAGALLFTIAETKISEPPKKRQRAVPCNTSLQQEVALLITMQHIHVALLSVMHKDVVLLSTVQLFITGESSTVEYNATLHYNKK